MIKDGKVTLVISDIPTPNGLAFSPDEKYLYANGSGANYIRRYEVLCCSCDCIRSQTASY